MARQTPMAATRCSTCILRCMPNLGVLTPSSPARVGLIHAHALPPSTTLAGQPPSYRSCHTPPTIHTYNCRLAAWLPVPHRSSPAVPHRPRPGYPATCASHTHSLLCTTACLTRTSPSSRPLRCSTDLYRAKPGLVLENAAKSS